MKEIISLKLAVRMTIAIKIVFETSESDFFVSVS